MKVSVSLLGSILTDMVALLSKVLKGSDYLMECLDKVPWFNGRQPREIYWLDNPEHLKVLGLTFHEGEKRADYYICSDQDEWILIERKDGSSRLDIALSQLKDTKDKLLASKRPVNRLITIADKFGHNDNKAFGRVLNHKNLLFAKKTNKRDGLPLCNIKVEFFTSQEVEAMKDRGNLTWLSR